jgi:hypothetical protein
LDYVPLRLGVMRLWAGYVYRIAPGAKGWIDSYQANTPLLWFNTAMEFLAAAGVFALVWMWKKHSQQPAFAEQRASTLLSVEAIALLAFTLAWLNPASIISAHGRPTWDVWVAPFYVWAIFAACCNRWFIAGCIIAVGTMLKGQQLIVAPIFLLWPLMSLDWRAMLRWIIGFAFAAGVIVSPWLVGQRIAPIGMILSAALLPGILWFFSPRVKLRTVPLLMAACIAIAIWGGGYATGGTFAWFKVGFIYGAEKHGGLEVGGASSLAAILQNRFRWRSGMPVTELPKIGVITIDMLMITIYAVLMLGSAFAMRQTQRRKDRVFLLAMAAPWIIYFAVFPKMHERYLLWGAIASCTAVAVGVGPTLLSIFFTLCQLNMSFYQLLSNDNAGRFATGISPTFGKSLLTFTRGTYPDLGWAVLLAAAVWMYLVLFYRVDWKTRHGDHGGHGENSTDSEKEISSELRLRPIRGRSTDFIDPMST